jgi:hypothetical protein
MSDFLVAVAAGETQFDPDRLTAAVLHRWPRAEVADVNGPELAHLAEFMTRQITIEDAQQRAIIEFNTGGRGIGIEGDDGPAAEFIALLTQNMPIPEDTIALMNWADGIVMLDPNMTADQVRALRG